LPKSIGVLHSKLLSLIIRDGETPDEDRLLDDDTWPEVMRQVILVNRFYWCNSLKLSNFGSIWRIRMGSLKIMRVLSNSSHRRNTVILNRIFGCRRLLLWLMIVFRRKLSGDMHRCILNVNGFN
jgi:hypothetical protein